MNDQGFVPTSYEQWRHFIEVHCGIKLTPGYVNERLSELQDEKSVRTIKFVECYGSSQLQNTIIWFRRALDELSG